MISELDLIEAINQYEEMENPTAQTCIALAAFYTVKDRLYPERQPEPSYSSDTRFGRMAHRCCPEMIYGLMDELLDTIQVLNEPLYESVMQKLEDA